MSRTQQDLNQEYTALCSQLGQIAEIRNQLDKDEDALFTRLEALKSEAQEVKNAEEAKAQAEAPKAEETPNVQG